MFWVDHITQLLRERDLNVHFARSETSPPPPPRQSGDPRVAGVGGVLVPEVGAWTDSTSSGPFRSSGRGSPRDTGL